MSLLIEQGVLKSFIYDLKTAAQSGVASTGNAARGLFNPPEPSFSNLVIQPGETPLKDILAASSETTVFDFYDTGAPLGMAYAFPLLLWLALPKRD